MNHPLTDEMIEEMMEEKFSENYDESYVVWITGGMRAAYDLGFKAGTQASEGAMQAILDTIQQNSEAMRILAKGGVKKKWGIKKR